MVAKSINDRNVWEILLEDVCCDIDGQQVGVMVLGPHIMGWQVSSHIPLINIIL